MGHEAVGHKAVAFFRGQDYVPDLELFACLARTLVDGFQSFRADAFEDQSGPCQTSDYISGLRLALQKARLGVIRRE